MSLILLIKVLGVIGGLALYLRGGVLYLRTLGLSDLTLTP